VGALPRAGGFDAGQMLSRPMKALFLLGVEPAFDAANPAAAMEALKGAGLVVSMTPFKDANTDIADVLLPVAPFTETGGAFVNAEGRLQSFHGVVKPLGETRPAWKVLRVLGNLLGLQGFEQETVEEVRAEALGDAAAIAARLDNRSTAAIAVPAVAGGLERVTDVPIYATDPIVRRAPSLQATADAAPAIVGVPSALWREVGDKVVLTQGAVRVTLPAREDTTLAPNALRVPAPIGAAMFGPISIERA
jgi:NADH-quinone oxidoreductase subunit G